MYHMYYRRDETPIQDGEDALLELARNFEKQDRIIARKTLWWSGYVSTVFLGINHAFREGPPLIFETMVFTSGGKSLGMNRYSTEEQARGGHKIMVRKWSNPLFLGWNLIKNHL